MKKYTEPSRENWEELVSRPVQSFQKIKDLLLPVMQSVRLQGDKALCKYTRQFDGAIISKLRVSQEEIDNAKTLIPDRLKQAIEIAFNNIKKFHDAQRQKDLV
ncbi:MAG: histidinol dehydrogenase, partial [Cytophagales bacterium]|nr:histidinol dehydrogenase [Cytophagales bacterium]